MMTKTFDCVEYQRKVRDELMREANYDLNTFKVLIREKISQSEFVKKFKESLKLT